MPGKTEEKENLVRETEELTRYQEEPTPKEDLEKIPLLSREDIGKKALPFSNIEKEIKGTKVLHHDYFTNGIYYIDLYFDIKPLLAEYAPYISLLTSLIGCVDTDMNGWMSAEDRAQLEDEIPYGRMCTPAEVADFVRLLAAAPTYLTGQIIRFDGGWI